MKNFAKSILLAIKYLFVNPFWRSARNVVLLAIGASLNGLIWFLYLKNGQEMLSMISIFYSSGVVVLNTFLANLVYDKEEIVGFILLIIMVLIQVIFLAFLRLFALS